jgi:hypothetical protein
LASITPTALSSYLVFYLTRAARLHLKGSQGVIVNNPSLNSSAAVGSAAAKSVFGQGT